MGRTIEDESVRLLGLSLPFAIHARGCSFDPRARSCLGLWASLRLDGCDRLEWRARADGAEWSVAFHRSPGRGSPAAESAHGFRVRSVGLATDPVSNTSFVVCRVRALRVDRSLSRDATRNRCSPLTSLQRVEATDALPILARFLISQSSPRTGSLSEVFAPSVQK